MSFTYQSVVDLAEVFLKDESNDRWDAADLFSYAIEGENEAVREKPDINAVVETVGTLTAGCIQSLPSLGIQLLDVTTNMGTDGTTRGNIVTMVERKYMDRINPGWMTDTASATITHVIYDFERLPKKYWVYPQSPGTNYLEVITSKLFDNGSKVIGDNALIADEYKIAIKHYILASAYAMDEEDPYSNEKAVAHYNRFLSILQTRNSLERQLNPKRTNEGV